MAFFQAQQTVLKKKTGGEKRKSPEQIDVAVRQFISKAVAPDGEAIDVFTAASLQKPDISILSDQFREAVRGLKHKQARHHSPDGYDQRKPHSLIVRPD